MFTIGNALTNTDLTPHEAAAGMISLIPEGASVAASQFGRYMTLDNQGGVYVLGDVINLGYDTTRHAHDNEHDLHYIVKLDGNGKAIWRKKIDAPRSYTVSAMQIDRDGNNHLLLVSNKKFNSPIFSILKISPDGDLVWGKNFSAAQGFFFRELCLALDGEGRCFVAGVEYTQASFVEIGNLEGNYYTILVDQNGDVMCENREDSFNKEDNYRILSHLMPSTQSGVFYTLIQRSLRGAEECVFCGWMTIGGVIMRIKFDVLDWIKTSLDNSGVVMAVGGENSVVLGYTAVGGSAVVTKYRVSSTKPTWSNTLTSSNGFDRNVDAIATDSEDNTYVLLSDDSDGSHMPTLDRYSLIKFDRSGSRQWEIELLIDLPRSATSWMRGITVSDDGEIYGLGDLLTNNVFTNRTEGSVFLLYVSKNFSPATNTASGSLDNETMYTLRDPKQN